MNTLLSSLAEVCRKHRFASKFLLVDSYRSGHQLLEALARQGVYWLNLIPVTPLDLALQTAAGSVAAKALKLGSEDQFLFLLDETLEEMGKHGELQYFSELEGTENLAGLLKGSLMELRMAGVYAEQVSPDCFVDEQKGHELRSLLHGYEKRLQNLKLLDQAALFALALQLYRSAEAGGEVLYLIPEQMGFEYYSYTFVERLTSGRRLILPAEGVNGISRQDKFYFQPENRTAKLSSFSWLFELQNAPPSDEIELEIFQAYGASCEVTEVFRRLQRDNIPADRAMLCYTNTEAYLPLILSLSTTYQVPVTFAEGLPVGFTGPGKLLLGLLLWMEENYAVPVFYRLFTESTLNVSSGLAQARLLRRAGIGWGRQRYVPFLEELAVALQADAQKAKREEREGLCSHLLEQREKVLELQELVSFILDRIPPEDANGQVDFEQLCDGLAEILQAYSRNSNSLDVAAREALLEQLGELTKSLQGEVPLRVALKRLRARLKALRVGASGFEPGHLYAASLSHGEWSLRPHVFIVGLNEGNFPGSGLQDPVLLDGERAALNPNLKSISTAPEQNVYRLNRFLASCRGKITLSFPSFDPAEGRASFPAAALLQAYRLRTGEHEADYSAFLNSLERPVAYFPEEQGNFFCEEEWWGSLVLKENKAGGLESVRRCYPNLHNGLLAEEARSGEVFTSFDGKVEIDPHEADPRISRRPLSATGIERLAACPFAYFLRYLLRVEPPDEQIFDPNVWLDPLSRGLLLHEIYARYLGKICTTAEGPASEPSADRDLLFKIAEELLEETRKSIPPPSPVVYEYEKESILKGLEVFLRVEKELWQEGSIPMYLEVPFGFVAEDPSMTGQGLTEPVQVSLPDGNLVHLRGRIDRIDSIVPQGAYRVWDFKTGSTYGFEERTYIQQGRQIQHALYALAAEKILQQEDPKARVAEAGYIFPTEKGEGERFLKRQSRRQEALEALQKMLDLLAAGVFCASHEQKRCQYCDYQLVCRFPQSVQNMNKKLDSSENAELEPWKELQEYD